MKWDFPLVMYSGLLLSFCLLKTHPFIPINCTLTFRSASIFECNNPKFNQPMDRTKFITYCCFLSFFLKIRFTWIAITRRKICHYFQFIVTNSLETFLGHYSNVSKFVTLAMWTQMFLLPLKLWIVVKYWIMWSSGVHAARGLLSLKQMSNKPNTETFFRFNHFSIWLWLKLLWG